MLAFWAGLLSLSLAVLLLHALAPSAADYLRLLAANSAARSNRLCFAACFRADGPCGTHLKNTFGIF